MYVDVEHYDIDAEKDTEDIREELQSFVHQLDVQAILDVIGVLWFALGGEEVNTGELREGALYL
jgi:hypothetical protein